MEGVALTPINIVIEYNAYDSIKSIVSVVF